MAFKYFYGFCRYDPSTALEIFNSEVWVPFAGGGSGNEVTDYGLDGILDGVNEVFTTAFQYVAGSVKVYVNGVRQFKDEDYTEHSGGYIIQFVTAPEADTLLIADYRKHT